MKFLKARDKRKNLKQSAFLRILAMSGCHIGEILGLEWRSISFEDNLPEGKIDDYIGSNQKQKARSGKFL